MSVDGSAGAPSSTDEGEQREPGDSRREKMLALSQLAGGIAHDINNLLMAIRGNAEMVELSLQDRGLLDADELLHKSLADIQAAVKLGRELTDRLLVFGRRRVAPSRAVTVAELTAAITEARESLAPPERELRLELCTEQGAGILRIDGEQILRCVRALIANACEGSPSGAAVELCVEPVELHDRLSGELPTPPGTYLRVEVRDHGQGMNAEVLRRMFEPFFSTKDPAPGRGIGLATVWSVVEGVDGGIDVESLPERGTRVALYLPLELDGAQRTNAAPKPSANEGPLRVMIVEDLDSVRRVFVRGLRRAGFEVLAAPDAEAALDMLGEADAVDVLVTDLVMPGLSGFELAERLGERDPELRVLFVSGHAELDEVPNHPFEFLPKPFSIGELVERIERIAGRGRGD